MSVLFLPQLLTYGMFFDGLTYAGIARNMAIGKGTFWQPFYTETIYPEFYEHPPLALGVQSILFRLFGDHFAIERISSFAYLILVMCGMGMLWQIFSTKKTFWIPAILLLTIPVFSWSFRNNLLENTLTVFTICSVFFYVNAFKGKAILHLILGSTFCVAAFLSKGPVGLFPIVVPIGYYLIFKPEINIFRIIAIQFATAILLFMALIFIWPESLVSFSKYMETQVIASLTKEREITTDYRLRILGDLLIELTIPIGLLILTKIKRFKLKTSKIRSIYFFLFVALCASVPLIISLKQRKFYLVPSLPYYCIAIGLAIKPYVLDLLQKYAHKVRLILSSFSYAIIAVSIVLMTINYGAFSRDEQVLECTLKQANESNQFILLEGYAGDCHDWTLVAYMMRYKKISLSCESEQFQLCD